MVDEDPVISNPGHYRTVFENIGQTPTHTILIELKGDAAGVVDERVLGPEST